MKILLHDRFRYQNLMCCHCHHSSASVDVREEMQPHPCFDFLVWFDPDKLTRKSVFLNVLRHADKLVCSPAGLAFVSKEGTLFSTLREITEIRHEL